MLTNSLVFTKQENEAFRANLSAAGNPPAIPFPSFTWSRENGEAVVNMTGRVYGYPFAIIESVQPSDIGYYNLTAVNFLPGGITPVGKSSVFFYLNVLCE